MSFPRANQHAGPMAGHVRKGRVYKSPLAATGVLNVENWIKDDLPDLLWPAIVLAEKFSDAPAIVVSEAESWGLLSAEVNDALASYPYLPARWLVGGVEALPARERDLELIKDALLGVIKDGHREALLKCLRTWSTVQAGTFRSSADTIDLLKDYPGEPTKRSG